MPMPRGKVIDLNKKKKKKKESRSQKPTEILNPAQCQLCIKGPVVIKTRNLQRLSRAIALSVEKAKKGFAVRRAGLPSRLYCLLAFRF